MNAFHVIEQDNKYTIFHPESLRLFSVTDDIGKSLKSYESENIEYRPTLWNHNSHEIVSPNLLSYFKYINRYLPSKDAKWSGKEPRTLCLIISHDCNLRCGYCFADHGTFGDDEKLMCLDTAKKGIDKLLDKKFQNFIMFYGGEPFMNFSLMSAVEEYGHENDLDIHYVTITNGTILNDSIEKFIEQRVSSLGISLDGPKEVNDSQRYGHIESVHDEVIRTINRLKSTRCPLAIKCIITKNSINKLEYITKYITSLGIDSIAFADVSRIPQESKLFITDNEFEIYTKELSNILKKNLKELASGTKTALICPTFDILRLLITKTRAIHYCSAGREYIAVTAEGDVYPCHGFVGMEKFKMGNVQDEDFPGEAYNKIKSMFNNQNVYTSSECKSCWAKFLCGGDCAVHSYIYNGELSRPTKRHCILTKSMLNAILPEIASIFQNKEQMQNLLSIWKTSKFGNAPQSRPSSIQPEFPIA